MKALLVVDVQKGLMDKNIYNKDLFIKKINDAIAAYERGENKIILIQHNNKTLAANTTDWEIDRNIVYNSEACKVIQKYHGNAFEETTLDEYLRNNNIIEIVVCGLVTHGCVKATCVGGLSNGFQVSILKNGHSCWSSDAKEKIQKVEKELEENGVKIIEI